MKSLAGLLVLGGVECVMAFAGIPSGGALKALRMSVEPNSFEDHAICRRNVLFGLLATPAAMLLPQPASAQFDIIGDLKGERPSGLGPVSGGRFLSLCDSENCVSTSEDVYSKRYLPPWTYEGTPKTRDQARSELLGVLKDMKGANIVTSTDNYVYVEFEREFGLIDDVEFLFPADSQTVEYRSSSRKKKKSDHRGRIRSIRLALQPKGWKSVGYRCESYSYNAMGDMLCERKPAAAQLSKEESDMGIR